MKTRLINFWDRLRGSYWFVPTLMSLGAVILSVVSLDLDKHLSYKGVEKIGWLWAGGAGGARSILSTIASSMITVAGVVFSITIVALTLASSQFGPRLLRNFVRDTVNQIVLGTFVATYLYCLLILREVRDVNEQSFVPYLSVTVAVALTAASLGMLIFFIHHVAISIQAENMVASVAAEMRESINALFPEKAGSDQQPTSKDLAIEKSFERKETCKVFAKKSGYLQLIETEALLQRAQTENVVLRLLRRPGEFVISGTLLAEFLPEIPNAEEFQNLISECHIIDSRRTPRQDSEYCINQLVEIAVRALSPGINDPFTAIACTHWLGDGISQAAGREMPSPYRYDDSGELRIIAKAVTFNGLTDAAFNSIRQYGAANVAVSLSLLETLAEIVPQVIRISDLDVLKIHAEMTARCALANSPDPQDASDIKERLSLVSKAVEAAKATAENPTNA